MHQFTSRILLAPLLLCLGTPLHAKSLGEFIPDMVAPRINCDHFIGTWTSETHNPFRNYTNIQTATYTGDGKLQLTITIENSAGGKTTYDTETRNWYCDGNVYITRNDPTLDKGPNGPAFKVYKLLETSKERIRYRTIVGHSPGVEYSLERSADEANAAGGASAPRR